MRIHFVSAIVTILILALAVNITQYPLASCTKIDSPQTEKAVKYLTDVMFVPSLGLDKCSPIAESNTVWLTNDNLLAYAVLLNFNRTMADTLKQGLVNYNVSGNGLVEVSLNQTIDSISGSSTHNIAAVDQYIIKADTRDGGVMYDFEEYADLCFWWSQNLLLKNDVNGAIASFEKGMTMWNGTGFQDIVFNKSSTKEFQTFKVGLALWIADRLNYTTGGKLYQQATFTEADYTEMQNIIWTLQDPKNGGIHTGYTSTSGTISSNTDTNVETTSICLLYLTVPPPPPPLPTYYLSLELTSPVNSAYTTSTIPLNYQASTNGTGLLVKYSLNNQANISLSGNTTLPELANGQYTLVLYASIDQGNQSTSRIDFEVNEPTPTPTPSPTVPELPITCAVLFAALIIPLAVIKKQRKDALRQSCHKS